MDCRFHDMTWAGLKLKSSPALIIRVALKCWYECAAKLTTWLVWLRTLDWIPEDLHQPPGLATLFTYLLIYVISLNIYLYRVLQNVWSTLKAFNWLIFKSFIVYFVFFWLSDMGNFSLWISFPMGMNYFCWKPNPEKMSYFRVGSNWLNWCWLNFEGCQL